MARTVDTSSGARHEMAEAVRGSVADALGSSPPAHDLNIERLRVRVPAGAGAAEVGHAIARALERALREPRRR